MFVPAAQLASCAPAVLILTLGHGVYGFTLDTASGEFFLTHDKLVIPDPATDPKAQRIYSGNLGNVGMWQPAELKVGDAARDGPRGRHMAVGRYHCGPTKPSMALQFCVLGCMMDSTPAPFSHCPRRAQCKICA